MPDDGDAVGDPGGRLQPLLATAARRPRVWLPPATLAVLAVVLAQLVRPWPEGPILLTLHGFGPHGITTSDLVVAGLLVVLSAAWVRAVWPQDGP